MIRKATLNRSRGAVGSTMSNRFGADTVESKTQFPLDVGADVKYLPESAVAHL